MLQLAGGKHLSLCAHSGGQFKRVHLLNWLFWVSLLTEASLAELLVSVGLLQFGQGSFLRPILAEQALLWVSIQEKELTVALLRRLLRRESVAIRFITLGHSLVDFVSWGWIACKKQCLGLLSRFLRSTVKVASFLAFSEETSMVLEIAGRHRVDDAALRTLFARLLVELNLLPSSRRLLRVAQDKLRLELGWFFCGSLPLTICRFGSLAGRVANRSELLWSGESLGLLSICYLAGWLQQALGCTVILHLPHDTVFRLLGISALAVVEVGREFNLAGCLGHARE